MSFGEGNLHGQVDKLRDLNGELCAEINEQQRRIGELEALVRQLWHLVNHRSGYGYAAALESIEELEIEVNQ